MALYSSKTYLNLNKSYKSLLCFNNTLILNMLIAEASSAKAGKVLQHIRIPRQITVLSNVEVNT